MSRTTPRCFSDNGRGRYRLCLTGDGGCRIIENASQGKCLGEVACEELLPFEGPPVEDLVLDKTIAVFDGRTAYLLEKGVKITVIRYESYMIASYVATGDDITTDTVVAGKLSRKGVFRKERPGVSGKVILVTEDPLGKVRRHIILVDTMGVHRTLECRQAG